MKSLLCQLWLMFHMRLVRCLLCLSHFDTLTSGQGVHGRKLLNASWKTPRQPQSILLPVGLALALLSLPSLADASQFPDRYDRDIIRSVSKWWPRHTGWQWWKSQLYQESLLRPDAVSPVGARGLAQFMPGTWNQIAAELGVGHLSPHLAKPAINAGAYYMRKLARGWSSPRPDLDRWDLARASYNAGFGNILKAQTACGNPNLYADIMLCLQAITGRHSRETHTYVARIHKWHDLMIRCKRC